MGDFQKKNHAFLCLRELFADDCQIIYRNIVCDFTFDTASFYFWLNIKQPPLKNFRKYIYLNIIPLGVKRREICGVKIFYY